MPQHMDSTSGTETHTVNTDPLHTSHRPGCDAHLCWSAMTIGMSVYTAVSLSAERDKQRRRKTMLKNAAGKQRGSVSGLINHMNIGSVHTFTNLPIQHSRLHQRHFTHCFQHRNTIRLSFVMYQVMMQ